MLIQLILQLSMDEQPIKLTLQTGIVSIKSHKSYHEIIPQCHSHFCFTSMNNFIKNLSSVHKLIIVSKQAIITGTKF